MGRKGHSGSRGVGCYIPLQTQETPRGSLVMRDVIERGPHPPHPAPARSRRTVFIPLRLTWMARRSGPSLLANDKDDAGKLAERQGDGCRAKRQAQPYATWPDRSPRKGKAPSTRWVCWVALSHSGTLYVVSRHRAWNCSVGSSKWWSMILRAGRTAGTSCTPRRPGTATCGLPSWVTRGGVPRSVAPWLRGSIRAGIAILGLDVLLLICARLRRIKDVMQSDLVGINVHE